MDLRHITVDGQGLELLLQTPPGQEGPGTKPPLLFVHGSYHGGRTYLHKRSNPHKHDELRCTAQVRKA